LSHFGVQDDAAAGDLVMNEPMARGCNGPARCSQSGGAFFFPA
jgi:hypothetical protein